MKARLRTLAGLAASAAVMIAISAGSASASSPSQEGPSGTTFGTILAHSCQSVGSIGSWQGVFCADLIEYEGQYYAQAEAICQTTGSTPATGICNNVYLPSLGLYYIPPGGSTTLGGSMTDAYCEGNCTSPRSFFAEPFGQYVSGYNYWAVVGNGAFITLPNGQTEYLNNNLGSGHVTA